MVNTREIEEQSDEEEHWGEDAFPGTRRPSVSNRASWGCLSSVVVCWLLSLYSIYYRPDTHRKGMVDCYGANANVTVRYEGFNVSSLSSFGIFSGLGENDTLLPTAQEFVVVGIHPVDACEPLEDVIVPNVTEVDGTMSHAALVGRGGCTFAQKFDNLKNAGISLMIEYDAIHDDSCVRMNLTSNETSHRVPGSELMGGVSVTSRTAYTAIIPFLPNDTHAGDQRYGVETQVYSKNRTTGAVIIVISEPERHGILFGVVDASQVILLVYAVCAIAMGSWWARCRDTDEYRMYQISETDSVSTAKREEDSYVLSLRTAWSFVFLASFMLLIMFFLSSSVLASLFALLFAVSGWESTHMVVSRSVQRILMPLVPLEVLHVLDIVSLVGATVVAGGWLLARDTSYWWIGQDILAFFLIVVTLDAIRIPTMKIGVVLLLGALVYDVFWVYIQPEITGTASVMVSVVKGLSLPLFIAIPAFSSVGSNAAMCILGLGDVVLPGLWIVFAAASDAASKHIDITDAPSYWSSVSLFYSTLAGYVVGLLLTNIALWFNIGGQGGQPALLYIIPCILGIYCLVAWRKKQLHVLWKLHSRHHASSHGVEEEEEPLL